MRYKLLLIHISVLAFSFLSINKSYSKHIVGGEAVYKVISSDGFIGGEATYEFKFTIYRDAISGGADFDKPGYFGFYRKESSGWVFIHRETKYIVNVENIQNVDDPCIVSPPEIQYQKGDYVFRVTLPIIDSAYQITYQRCCRTNFIVNIESPEATGATYFVEISPEAQLLKNNSPVFRYFPPTVLCANSVFNFDNSASDVDGDSLVYEYFNPLSGGGLAGSDAGTGGKASDCNGVQPLPDNCPPPFPEVVFSFPYSYNDPILGSPSVQINRFTGNISGKPLDLGQFVVGVRVLEYRDGILIGKVQRDFQFNVASCSPSVNAIVGNSNQIDVNKFDIKACGIDTVTFINRSIERDKISDTYWEFDIDGEIVTSTDWDATVVFPGVGSYTGRLFLNRNTICNDSAELVINVFPGIHAEFEFDHDSCTGDPVIFNDHSYSEAGPILEWKWDFGDGMNSSDSNPKYTYSEPGNYISKLIVEDKNECQDTAVAPIGFFPLANRMDINPSHYIGCAPVSISFNNKTELFSDQYEIKWDFGDGQFDTIYSPIHLYDEPGIYSVNVEIKTPLGCTLEGNYSDWLDIRPSPIADFDYSPLKPKIVNPVVNFENNSVGGKTYLWELGAGKISFDFEPEFMYPDTGLYNVKLIVTSENHCNDTLVKQLYIYPDVNLFFPNAFTPNGDGVNDVFFGKGVYHTFMKEYNLYIFDRWGGLVFESNDPLKTWYGSKFNSGSILPQGVYVYKYNYKNPKGKVFKGKGFVTIIK